MKIAKYYSDVKLPERKHSTDAGLDLYAYINDVNSKSIIIKPGEFCIVETGVTVEIPMGCVGLIWPKSKSDFLIGGGVVDSSYQGQILVKIMNVTKETVYIYHGDAIAQLLIQPVLTPEVNEVSMSDIHRKKSERGDSGGIVSQFDYLVPKPSVPDTIRFHL